MISILRVVSNAKRWLLMTVNCDVNKKIRATWHHYKNNIGLTSVLKRKNWICAHLVTVLKLIIYDICPIHILELMIHYMCPNWCLIELTNSCSKFFANFEIGKNCDKCLKSQWNKAGGWVGYWVNPNSSSFVQEVLGSNPTRGKTKK